MSPISRVEDHDDLTPIFNRQSDVLSSTYGRANGHFLTDLVELGLYRVRV